MFPSAANKTGKVLYKIESIAFRIVKNDIIESIAEANIYIVNSLKAI